MTRGRSRRRDDAEAGWGLPREFLCGGHRMTERCRLEGAENIGICSTQRATGWILREGEGERDEELLDS